MTHEIENDLPGEETGIYRPHPGDAQRAAFHAGLAVADLERARGRHAGIVSKALLQALQEVAAGDHPGEAHTAQDILITAQDYYLRETGRNQK